MLRILVDNLHYILTCLVAFLLYLRASWLIAKGSLNKTRPGHTPLILSIAIFVSLALSFYPFTIDDTFISLRYARNLAYGHGLVFSTDGSIPVEGYTNFLWVLVETPLFIFNLDDSMVLHAIKILGIAFGIGVIVVVYLLARLVTNNLRIAQLAVLFLASIPHFAFWAIGGLETTMYMFWMMMGVYHYVKEEQEGRAHMVSMLFLTLMAFTRPEGLLFILTTFVYEGASALLFKKSVSLTERLKRLLPGIVIFILLYGGYFLWRYQFYGYPLPNSFYAKQVHSPFHLINRFNELSPFFVYLLPAAAVAWFGYFNYLRGRQKEFLLLAIMLSALCAFCFIPKTEWMPGYRYELPILPMLLFFFGIGIFHLLFARETASKFTRILRFGYLGTMILLGTYFLFPVLELHSKRNDFSKLYKVVEFGKWLKKYAPRNASYASWDMGATPYFSQLPSIIEINPEGLLSTHTTHKGYDVDHFLSLNPSFLALPVKFPSNEGSKLHGFYEHPDFKQKYEFVFSIYVAPEYIVNIYKHKNVSLSNEAIQAAHQISSASYADTTSR